MTCGGFNEGVSCDGFNKRVSCDIIGFLFSRHIVDSWIFLEIVYVNNIMDLFKYISNIW